MSPPLRVVLCDDSGIFRGGTQLNVTFCPSG